MPLAGMMLGIMAPFGWIVLRLLLFWQDGAGLVEQIVERYRSQSAADRALSVHVRRYGHGPRRLRLLHRPGHPADFMTGHGNSIWSIVRWPKQKAGSERRFHDLDRSIKNFHGINADLQKSSQPP
ncbi:MAG: hypothetical protein M0C28_37035 [Candidatus Moduliflexus flocculans]|nr:hypothetical protein [Candidatus Moduliflexus flocculans]